MKHDMQKAYKVFFGTLTSEIRLRIINALRESPKSVSELQDSLKLEQTVISHNLRRLRRCGFVRSAKDGRFRIYHLNKSTIKPIMKKIDKHMHQYCMKIIKGER